MPPPPAPQWFDCAWPIVILRSRFATSLCSHTGRAARGHADERVHLLVLRVVLEERDAHALHAREVVLADLLLGVGLRHREDLAVRADDDGVRDAGGLERVEDGGEDARLRRRPELVVDHDRDAVGALQQLAEARARMRMLERVQRRPRSHRPRPRARRAGSRRAGWPGDVELERVPVHELVVLGRADRERVDRLVRNHGAMHLRHPWGSSSLDCRHPQATHARRGGQTAGSAVREESTIGVHDWHSHARRRGSSTAPPACSLA